MAEPYLSIVCTARNDNYGDDFIDRLNVFKENLAAQTRHLPDFYELIVVEWNPPPENPRLKDALDWSGIQNLRIITVPHEYHEKFAGPSGRPMIEFVAKNVGIRRARGRFVLVTNPDLILSPDLLEWLATRTLDAQSFYRLDRYDCYPQPVIAHCRQHGGVHLFEEALKHVFMVCVRHDNRFPNQLSFPVDTDQPIDMWPMTIPMQDDEWLDTPRQLVCRAKDSMMWGLHINTGGDFILAPRDAFMKAKGYWELKDTHTQLDGYLPLQFYKMGLRPIVLMRPLMIIHLDHLRPANAKKMHHPTFHGLYDEMIALMEGRWTIPNPDNWGLADAVLKE